MFDRTKFIEEETYGEHEVIEERNSEGELVKKEINNPGVCFFIKQKPIWVNLLVMSYSWIVVTFCNYLLNYTLIYWPGLSYINSLVLSGADILSSVLSWYVYKYLNPSWSLFWLNLFAAFGGILTLTWGYGSESNWVFPFCICLSRLGATAA